MFDDELKQKAWKKTCLLTTNNIPDKCIRDLTEYIKSLSEKEAEQYIEIAQAWYDRKSRTKSRRIKITTNAIKLCLKLAENDIKTFPIVEKLATKGWSTSGGTYSFSMPLLTDGVVQREIFSFGPIEKLVKKDTVLDIGNSYYGNLEVDFK